LTNELKRVRRAQAADISALENIIRNVGLFTPDEADGFATTLVAHFEAPDFDEPIWLISEAGGAAYLAPGPTPDEWNLLFLGVLPETRRTGLGRALVVATERASRRRGARYLQIDTSDAPNLGAARALYANLGYLQVAVVPDHWGPGDAMVSYRKAL
jgi:GNAT superfamily N-acetyltransferase